MRDVGSRSTRIRLKPALTTVVATGCQTLDLGRGQNKIRKDSLFVSTPAPRLLKIFGLLSGLFLLGKYPERIATWQTHGPGKECTNAVLRTASGS